ncbi:MAG: SCO family protein [Candidatus Eremiobacteraeota bacterium]|nr:SCO family protein [Candidatus Eremiobacteraeota bacterium]
MTPPRAAAIFAALASGAISACTNGGGLGTPAGGGGGSPSPLPSAAIGVGIPSGKIGVENDPVWGTVGGYTQNKTSQVLAFTPGVTITITNLSKTTPHTLNVIEKTHGPPAHFPSNPSLPFSPRGNGILGPGYGSGALNAGQSVKVKLTKPGIYLIGCAFHYAGLNMRDVIQVEAGATPGPTASPGPGGYLERRPDPIGPRADLVDQRGRRFTLPALRGEPVVLTFVSAHCTDACPLINAQFSDAAQRLRRDGIAARLLTVTLDPKRDSPAVMRELAQRFGADPRYWLLASGTAPNVHAVMHRFGVISEEARPGESERHTTFVYLLDAQGRLAQTMLASTAMSDAIVDALHKKREVANR